MADIGTAELIHIFCRTERATVWCARAPTIVCDNGHEVARNFPNGEFWHYCCDCNRFTPLDALNGDEAYTRCPYCDEQPLTRWFLCNNCKLLTVESDKYTTSKSFALANEGKPSPTCPGCLTTDWNDTLAKHQCKSLGVTYLTPRLLCPFCKERLSEIVPIKPLSEVSEPLQSGPKTVSGLRFLEAFGHSNTWIDWFKSHRPKTWQRWMELIGVFGIGVTIVSIALGIFGPAAAVSRRVKKAFNHPPRVEAIECEHVAQQGQRVPLKARADDSDGDELRFRWTSSAGRIEGAGAQVYLVTDGIVPNAISTDLTVEVFVTDQVGETASRQERISVFSRKVLNNPPVFKIPPRCNCSNPQIRAGESMSVYALAEDEDKDETLTYDWQTSSSALEIVKTETSASGSTAILNTAGINLLVVALPVKVNLRVSDSHGGQVTGDITITILPRQIAGAESPAVSQVRPNHSPKLEAFTADKNSVETGDVVKLWAFVTDPDGDAPLYYDWKASAGEIIMKGETATFNTAGLGPGEIIITVTVSDGHGGSTSQKLFLTIKPSLNKTVVPSQSPVELSKPNVPLSLFETNNCFPISAESYEC